MAFFHAAESGGFSLPLLAAQVEVRIVSKIVHLAPFLCLAQGVFNKLNRLQWKWGKMMLGIPDHVEIRQALVRAHCGWQLSLGAKVVLEVLAVFARISLLSPEHPLQQMRRALSNIPILTWETQVRNWLASLEMEPSLQYRSVGCSQPWTCFKPLLTQSCEREC